MNISPNRERIVVAVGARDQLLHTLKIHAEKYQNMCGKASANCIEAPSSLSEMREKGSTKLRTF
jgi:hypothetical protein